jgi:two-component system response regulator (stage 0 sporulation protein F)
MGKIMTEKIMVVEYCEGIRLFIQNELELCGYKVIPAVDGLEASEILLKSKVDLICLDMKMPGIDGIELIRNAKALDKKIRIVLFTDFSVLMKKLFQYGIDACLEKSVDTTELKATINTLLTAKRSAASPIGIGGGKLKGERGSAVENSVVR